MKASKMNRQQRRASVSDSRKKAKGGWEPLKRVVGVVGHPLSLPGMVSAWNNHTYSVQVFGSTETPLGRAFPLGIRRHDGGANFPWADLQRIKNEIYGPEIVAVEVFPGESELVDEANMRWLFVLPAAVKWKFPNLSAKSFTQED